MPKPSALSAPVTRPQHCSNYETRSWFVSIQCSITE